MLRRESVMQKSDYMIPEVVQGIRAAGCAAIKQARRTRTNLVVLLDEKIVEITPDEAEAMLAECKTNKEKK
jgi:hypothetical protein